MTMWIKLANKGADRSVSCGVEEMMSVGQRGVAMRSVQRVPVGHPAVGFAAVTCCMPRQWRGWWR